MIEFETVGEHPKYTHNGVRFAEEIIRVEFVGTELVRCRDCKHYQAQDPTRPTTCAVGLENNLADDFCSRGERKEEV